MEREVKIITKSGRPYLRREKLSPVRRGQEVLRSSHFTDRLELILANRSAEIVDEIAHAPKVRKTTNRRRRLALLLPGHNEELIIATTIHAAIAAGMNPADIFVVDDSSTDKTRRIAIKELGKANVLTVERSGKAMAVKQAIDHFKIESRYVWIHIADADSLFGPDYFRIYRRKLNAKKYVVALGFVQSMKGNWISDYRSFSYSYGQHILRRIQSALNAVTVFPGPVTCFNTRIIKHLDFDTGGLTEDFDLTLQVHRYKLGKILFIPEAVNYTQDPLKLRDFVKQNQRWLRGFFQGLLKYRVGRKLQPIDFYIVWQLFEATFYLVEMLVLLPILAITTHSLRIPFILFAADYIVLAIFAIISAIAARRWSVIKSLPYYYILRWIEIGIFVTSYVEVVMLHRFRGKITGWNVKGRRYALDDKALQEVVR